MFRVIVGLFLLLLTLLAATALLLSTSLLEPSVVPGLGPALMAIIKADPPLEMPRRAFVASVSILTGMAGMGGLTMILLGYGGQKPNKITMQKTSGAAVYVEPEGIGSVVSDPILRVPGVVGVETKTTNKVPLKLSLKLSVSPVADLTKLGDEVRRRATDALSRQLDIDVKSVHLDFDVIPLHRLRSKMLDQAPEKCPALSGIFYL